MMTFLLGAELGPSGTLEFLGAQWLIAVAVLMGIAALVLSFFGARKAWQRVLEMSLWGASLAGVCLAIAQPTWIEEEGRTEPGRVAVLVDASRSMGVLEDGSPRHAAVPPILDRLRSSDVDVYHFGGDLVVGEPSEFTLPATDLEGAFDALSERVAGETLAGVVVVSDGLDRGLLRRRYQREDNPVPPKLPGPLTVYQVGDRGDLHDLSVRSVDTGGYAFRSEAFTLSVTLDGLGYGGRSVPVTLTRDGRPVTQKQVVLAEDGSAEVRFDVRPQAVGRFTYEVSVPTWDDDAVPANNTAPVVVQVVRDRISILQVAGAPSWDVKFLRRFLKGDPSVDLVSFFILRTTDDIDGTDYSGDELSLIQFPYSDLFSKELERFDVVIFQNFDHQRYFRPAEADQLLDNIRNFVEEEGKGFVMIGGDKSFDMGGYAGTDVEDMLPTTLGSNGDLASLDSFQPALTADGQRHPITRLVSDLDENQAWWQRLVPLDGTNIVKKADSDATVLLAHPTLKGSDGEPLPILAVSEAGKGRAMALTVDTSWRWSFSEAAEGRGNQAYLRFWKNSFRWLVKDPSTSRVTVDTPRENYAMGDTVRIVVRARDTGFSPLARADVTVTVKGPDGEVLRDGVTSADGEIVVEVPAESRGAHRINAVVAEGGKEVGSSSTVYAVTTRDPELDEVAPDEGFLKWLAESTEGQFHPAGTLGAPLRDAKSGRTVWERRETPLWRAPLLGIWVTLLGGLAWIVRRRSGLR
ncbi:MAG: glutamine amidotransferase [Myxococcota bacterium]